jgi:hypothetical protein
MWYTDKIELCTVGETGHDEKGDPIISPDVWTDLGTCKIHNMAYRNPASKRISSKDGNDFVYSYQIVMFTPSILPKIDDKVRITKADNSISNKVMTVIGCGTTKNKTEIFV